MNNVYQTYESYLKERGLNEAEFWSILTGGDRSEPIWTGNPRDKYINSYKSTTIGYESYEDQWRGLWDSAEEAINLLMHCYMYSYENIFNLDEGDGYLYFIYVEKGKDKDPEIFIFTDKEPAENFMSKQADKRNHRLVLPAEAIAEGLREELRDDDRLVIDYTYTDETPVMYAVMQEWGDEYNSLLILDEETISDPRVLAFFRKVSRLLDGTANGYQIVLLEVSDDPNVKPYKVIFKDPNGKKEDIEIEWKPSVTVFKERVSNSYKQYINELRSLSIDEVLSRAKEKVIMEELAAEVEDNEFYYIEEEEAEVLLTLSDPLKDLYVDYEVYRSYEEWDLRGGYNDIEEFLQEVSRELL